MLYSRMGAAMAIEKAPWGERMRATFMALPTVLLAAIVITSIYAGIATPSESAGVGFVAAMVITFLMGRMNWAKLKLAVSDSLTTTAMIFIIIAGAKVFSYAITLYLIPQAISGYLLANISSPTLFILAVGGVLLIIGFFLEALSMLLIMVPVLLPAVIGMGIDPIWFGIFFVVLIETALITPPVGLNLFIIQAVGKARLESVVKGAWPFALMMLCTAALLWVWKDLALYIPYKLF
jgi:C4-dicarboxylate transporter DctM subunit